MVVNEFDVVRVTVVPSKADAPLIVDANTVLSGAITFELFEAVSGRRAEIIQGLCGIDHERFTVKYQGLDARLTGVEPARVVTDILL